MSNRVMIVGTGNVGATIAYSLINQRTAVNELILTDIDKADAEGEAMDLRDALAVSPSFLKIRTGSYDDAKSCDVVIITAGLAQKPGETRLDLLKKNSKIMKDIVKKVTLSGFEGIFLIVSNPVDVLTYLAWKYSGFPSNRIIGSGTVLDSARLRQQISEYTNVNPKSIHAYQIGEHGDSEFTLWSKADIGGEPVSTILSQPKREEIERSVRTEVYEIIKRKGATYYGIGACVANILNCILNDERRVLPISSYDDTNNVFIGYPTIIGRRGVCRRLDIEMTMEEGVKYQKSINTIKSAIKFTN